MPAMVNRNDLRVEFLQSEAKDLCICLKIQMQGSVASLRMTALAVFPEPVKLRPPAQLPQPQLFRLGPSPPGGCIVSGLVLA